MVMEASPASALEVSQSKLLLQLLIVTLDAPAQLGQVDETLKGDVLWQRGRPVFGRLLLAFWPFNQKPFFGMAFAAMSGAHAQARKARGKSFAAALAPA